MLTAGTRFSHYQIIRSLGSGGMADVYEAEDTRLGRRVALKVLPPELGRQRAFIQRFQKEVRAAASLSHPGIVTVFEVGEAEGIPHYSMQLLAGGDLSRRIDQGLSTSDALRIVREIAEAFEHAHSRGLIHRDVKPANVMFTESGHAVLTDFGIVKATSAETRLTVAGEAIGTPRYMSPEQARGNPVDARADLYSLGVMLFEMLEGRAPYEAPDALSLVFMHVSEPIPELSGERVRYQPLIKTLMAKSAADRPASARALIEMLDSFAPSPASEVRRAQSPAVAVRNDATQLFGPPSPESPLRRSAAWRWWLAGLGVSVLAATLAFIYAGTPTSDPAPPAAIRDPGEPEDVAIPSVTAEPAQSTPAPTLSSGSPTQRPVNELVRPTGPPANIVNALREADANNTGKPSTPAKKLETRPRPGDPRCEEILVLFGLGQRLSDSQTRYFEQNCR